MAVDFGAKKWRALAPDWHMRYAKLRTSRKLMFASSLCSLFLTPSRCENGLKVEDHLLQEFSKPVLARLCGIQVHLSDPGKVALKEILVAYDRFLGILNAAGKRELDPKNSQDIALIIEMRSLGERIEEGLEKLFFDEAIFSTLTRQYALF